MTPSSTGVISKKPPKLMASEQRIALARDIACKVLSCSYDGDKKYDGYDVRYSLMLVDYLEKARRPDFDRTTHDLVTWIKTPPVPLDPLVQLAKAPSIEQLNQRCTRAMVNICIIGEVARYLLILQSSIPHRANLEAASTMYCTMNLERGGKSKRGNPLNSDSIKRIWRRFLRCAHICFALNHFGAELKDFWTGAVDPKTMLDVMETAEVVLKRFRDVSPKNALARDADGWEATHLRTEDMMRFDQYLRDQSKSSEISALLKADKQETDYAEGLGK